MIVVFPDHTHLLFFCIRGISFIKLKGKFDLPYCQNKHY